MAEHFPDATKKVDFISRDEVHVQIERALCEGLPYHRTIDEIPAADVRPVVKASWKKDNSYPGPGLMNLRCSVCGEFGGTWKDNTSPSMLYNFCPICGADMRESNLDATKRRKP